MTGLHRKRKRPTSTGDYAAMLQRMILAYGTRIGESPAAGLAHMRELEAALTDAVNLGIYTANRAGGHSINEMADMLNMSKQAIHKRVGLGEQVARRRSKTRAATTAAQVARPRELPPPSTTS